MATETIELLIKGGQASAGPPLGPKLGPTGMNVGEVVGKINELTREMKGMSVPVKVHLDIATKTFEVEIGTPPTAALIKKELSLEKGSGKAGSEFVADLPIDNVIKVAKIKLGNTLAEDMLGAVKEVIGTCTSMGIEVEGMPAKEAGEKIDQWMDKITGKVALEEHSAAELKAKQAELQAEIEAKHAEEAKEAEAESAEAPAEGEEAPAEGEAKPEEAPAEGEAKPAEEAKSE